MFCDTPPLFVAPQPRNARVAFASAGAPKWGLVRASNTGPVLVMRFEAGTEAELQTIKREEEREIQSARTAFRKPGLSNAALSPDGQIYAIVIARGMPAGATPQFPVPNNA